MRPTRRLPITSSAAGPLRGVVLIVLGMLALYRGWTLHPERIALLAYALGVLALAMGAWHLVRKHDKP
jgi:hypothetical protein